MDSKTKKRTPKQQRKAVLSVLLVVAILITTAFAFLSATDSKTNVFTVGSVDIEFLELFNGKTYGKGETPDPVNNIIPGQKIDKKPYIKNTGDNEAYVYFTVKVPIASDDDIKANNFDRLDIPVTAYAIQKGYKDAQNATDTWNLYFDETTSFGDKVTDSTKKELFTLVEPTAFNGSEDVEAMSWSQCGEKYITDTYACYTFVLNRTLKPTETTENAAPFTYVVFNEEVGSGVSSGSDIESNMAEINYIVKEDENGNTAAAQATLSSDIVVPEGYRLVNTETVQKGTKIAAESIASVSSSVAQTGSSLVWYVNGDESQPAVGGQTTVNEDILLYGERVDKAADYTGVEYASPSFLSYVLGFDANSKTPFAMAIGANDDDGLLPSVAGQVNIPANVTITINDDNTVTMQDGSLRGFTNGHTFDPVEVPEESFDTEMTDFVQASGTQAVILNMEYNGLTSLFAESSLKDLASGTYTVPVRAVTSALADITAEDEQNDPLYQEYVALQQITEELYLSDSVTNISFSLPYFMESPVLKSVYISSSCVVLDADAFDGQSLLKEIELSNNTTTIGVGAFSDCTGLTELSFPESVTCIGMSSVNGCSNLTAVNIGSNVETIGGGAFSGCTSLASITIPDSVKRIEDGAFNCCSSLTSISIPDSVTFIGGDGLFGGCTNLTTVTLSKNITSIGERAFESCDSLAEIVIPNGVTSIGDYAFNNCTGLKSVTIPESVTSIGSNAFWYCVNFNFNSVSYAGTTSQWSSVSIGDGAFKSGTTIHCEDGTVSIA